MFTSSVLFVGLVDSSAFCAIQSCNARPTNRADYSVGVLRMANIKGVVNPGDRFGMLTIVEEAERESMTKAKRRQMLCKCDCGNFKKVRLSHLLTGNVQSCGCLRVTRFLTHGHATRSNPNSAYNAWLSMTQRCRNPNTAQYSNYGGRGITVCERWLSFENFILDMGDKPSPLHSIDRKDNNGNYEPLNCRWATATEQGRNKRSNRMLTFNGETMCISAWAERLGMSLYTIYKRLDRSGYTVEEALTRPIFWRRPGKDLELKGGAT